MKYFLKIIYDKKEWDKLDYTMIPVYLDIEINRRKNSCNVKTH